MKYHDKVYDEMLEGLSLEGTNKSGKAKWFYIDDINKSLHGILKKIVNESRE